MNEEIQPSARTAAGLLLLAAGAGLSVGYTMTLAAPPGDEADAFFGSLVAMVTLVVGPDHGAAQAIPHTCGSASGVAF